MKWIIFCDNTYCHIASPDTILKEKSHFDKEFMKNLANSLKILYNKETFLGVLACY